MPKYKKNEESAEGAAAEVREKKKRTANPGVRVQGGRIYDSESGTTCHQCRQKTVEVKAKCTKCTLYWCPRCLLNRYGETVEEVTKLSEWPCPRCRDQCNCSNCRKKRGLEATGILANVCKAVGIGSVSQLLDKNPTAKRPTLPPAKPKSKVPKAPKEDKKPAAEPAASSQIPDGELDDRTVPFPESAPLRIFKTSGKRVRGVVWPADRQAPIAIPDDCSAGDLVEATEFLHVFGKEAGYEVVDLSLFAAELVQPAAPSTTFCEDRNSPVGKVHQTLLDLVRQDWGIKGSVGVPGWQQTMRQYLKQDLEEAAEKLGKSVGRSKAAELLPEDSGMDVDEPSCAAAAVEGGQETLPSYPQGGYWSLPPGVRLRMLRALCHDALATQLLREKMEKAMEESAAAAKEQQEEAAAARKKMRQAWQQERNRHIALLITGDGQGLTIEEQKELMETAKTKVVAAAAPEVAAAAVAHPALRTLPLGEDRDGRLFWKLQTGTLFTGQTTCLLAAEPWRTVEADEWTWLEDPKKAALSLDARGQMEGRLKAQLLKAFSITHEVAEEEVEVGSKENKLPASRAAAKNSAAKAGKPAKPQAKKRKP